MFGLLKSQHIAHARFVVDDLSLVTPTKPWVVLIDP